MAWRKAGREDRGVAWMVSAAALSAVVLAGWAQQTRLSLPCVLQTLTGIPCPTCGTTRMVRALMEGRVAEAFAWNPLAMMAGTSLLVAGALAPIWVAARLPLRSSRRPLGIPARWMIVAVLAANWAYIALREMR